VLTGLLLGAVVVLVLGIIWFYPRGEPGAGPQPLAPATPLETGKQLYASHCAQCHGDTGDGNGLAARFLFPKPRNFRLGQFRLVTTTNRVPSDDDLLNIITRGMPGSAMFPFGHLSDAERRGLVAYVRQLTRTGIEDRFRQAATEAGEELDPAQLARNVDRLVQAGSVLELPPDLPAASNESLARGREMYLKQCATCHGETGKGDGAKEQRDDDGTPTRPRDFTRGIFKGGRDRLQLYARIAIGMPGTPMPASPHLKPGEIGDMVTFIQSLSDATAQAKVEHKRSLVTARRTPGPLAPVISEEDWAAGQSVPMVVSPLWWREYAEPALQVQALHDGTALAVRLTWNDRTRNESAYRPEDFVDMAAVQLFKGSPEPFLGMGAANGQLDLWLWRASAPQAVAEAESILDDYPFDTPVYRQLTAGKEKGTPDFLTARAAGNLIVNPERTHGASNLAAKGFGSTTFRPQASQLVTASAAWKDGRWTVVLRRPLRVQPDDGVPLTPGEQCAVAFAIWDGEADDRDGQKLVSIWHDLKLE
jgi:mono/diheme cytochrome c family protein